jgi:ATPase subunit of ABC transporter with duplicated ATPase domains
VLTAQDKFLAEQAAWASAARVETQTVHATHNAIKAEDLSVYLGSRCLLANTELKISEQQHASQALGTATGSKSKGTCYGLVGVNGSGKSTLLRLIAEGRLPVPASWDTFLVNQHLPTPTERNPIEEVLTSDMKRMQLLDEQANLEEQMATLTERELQLLDDINKRLLALDGELSKWDDAEKDVTQILLALGFKRSEGSKNTSEPTLKTPMNELSGGWRMKVQLAKACGFSQNFCCSMNHPIT